MLIKKIIFRLLYFIIATLILNTNAISQETSVDKADIPMIDSIDYGENLLDSNEVYKKQFDSLSKDGEWVKAKKSDLIRDLDNIEEADLDFDYEEENEAVYVWRPYGINSYWNPYHNGSWIFTNYGWIWNSFYSWGWGPYNYGRWYFSNFYGWIWFPGNVWAPNWVTWRNYNNYAGWYPTCPRVYWRGAGNQICTNRLFTSVPRNWVFVNKKDFTKKIDNTTIVSAGDNVDILKNSERVKTAVYTNPSGPKIKYSGPDVKDISNESGETITPKRISITKSDGKQFVQVKSEVVSDTENKNNTLTKKQPVSKTKDDNPNTKSQVSKTGDDNTKTKTPVTKTKDSNSKSKESKKSTRSNKPKVQAKKPNGNMLENDFNNGYPNTSVPSGENPVSTGPEKQNAD